MKPEPTPWAAWLAAATALGVPPRAFWRLSLAEWRAIAGPRVGAVLDRAAFDALAARYPDCPT